MTNMINKNPQYIKARQYFTAQQYIEAEYPQLIQKNIKKLDISNLDLKGYLDLSNFFKLEYLDCSGNLLTELDLSQCRYLKKFEADNGLQIIWKKKGDRCLVQNFSRPKSKENNNQQIKKQRRQGCFISNSVIWNNLHPDFNFELSQAWRNLGFKIEQARDWIDIGLKPIDYEFAAWLRDIKQIEAEEVLNYANEKDLRREFNEWQQRKLEAQIQVYLKIK